MSDRCKQTILEAITIAVTSFIIVISADKLGDAAYRIHNKFRREQKQQEEILLGTDTDFEGREHPIGERLKYLGQKIAGARAGMGKLYYKGGELYYSGQWKKNKFHGDGTLYYRSGRVKYKGLFKDGVFESGQYCIYDERKVCIRYTYNKGKLFHEIDPAYAYALDDKINILGDSINSLEESYGELLNIINNHSHRIKATEKSLSKQQTEQ